MPEIVTHEVCPLCRKRITYLDGKIAIDEHDEDCPRRAGEYVSEVSDTEKPPVAT